MVSRRRWTIAAIVAAISTGATLGARTAAAACGNGYGIPSSPPYPNPASNRYVTGFSPRGPLGASGERHQPRNVALIFEAQGVAALDEATVRAEATVEVRGPEGPVAGTLRPLARSDRAEWLWQWLPNDRDAVAPGLYEVVVTLAARDPAVDATSRQTYSVRVEDRVLDVPSLPLQTDVARKVLADPSAELIRCSNAVSSCAGLHPVVLPTRHRAMAKLTFQGPAIPARDRAFLEPRTLVFTRKNGVQSSAQGPGGYAPSWDYVLGTAWSLDLEAADEYCVRISAKLVTAGPEAEVASERCVPHGALDLSVSEDENQRLLAEELRSCDNPVFPKGTTPAAQPGGGAEGCSLTRGLTADRSLSGRFLTVLALLFALRSRKRRASPIHG